MNANDVITSGVSPCQFLMHIDIGVRWLENQRRYGDVIDGIERGCLMAGCCWGGGETAELNTLPSEVCVLSGAMTGFTTGELINPASIQDGDVLWGFGSSGPHSNGYTGIRDLGLRLPNGYLTVIPGTRKTFAELVLEPTYIYVDAIERCLQAGVRIHAIFNITGHAFCKLMRPKEPHAYVVDGLPPIPSIFRFIQEQSGMDDRKLLKTLNCGIGMVICAPEGDGPLISKALGNMRRERPSWYPFKAWKIGHVEAGQTKSVHIPQMGVDYGPDDLDIR